MLQKCKICEERFKWSQVYKSVLFSYKPIVCENCRARHEVKSVSKTIVAVITIIAGIFFFSIFLSGMPSFPAFVSVLVFGFCISVLFPFITRCELDHSGKKA